MYFAYSNICWEIKKSSGHLDKNSPVLYLYTDVLQVENVESKKR